MGLGDGRSWPRYVGIGLLVVFSPVLLVAAWTILVTAPLDVLSGVRQVFAGRDVVQVADGFDTTATIALLLLVLGGLGALLRLSVVVLAGGLLLVVPIAAILSTGVEYGLGAMLTDRGYGYCTFHVTSRGRGEDGTYVYVRAGSPAGCNTVRTMFPPHQLVPGRRDSFDLTSP